MKKDELKLLVKENAINVTNDIRMKATLERALNDLNLELKTSPSGNPNFSSLLFNIQRKYKLNDYQTYIIGYNSNPHINWNTFCGGKFVKYHNEEDEDNMEESSASMGEPVSGMNEEGNSDEECMMNPREEFVREFNQNLFETTFNKHKKLLNESI